MLVSPPKPQIAHLILAAGSSSRMGEPKQLLPWGNTTLIKHAIMQSLGIEKVSTYVVLGSNYDLINEHIDKFQITVVQNVDWQNGMGSSIRAGIKSILKEKMSYDAVLISLIDQPLIDHKHFKALITKFYKSPSLIVGSDLGDDRIGVPAIFSNSIFNELELLKEDYGARHIIKNHINEVDTIPAVNIGVDIDTKEQYQVLLQSKFR